MQKLITCIIALNLTWAVNAQNLNKMDNSKQKTEEDSFLEYEAIEKALNSYVSSAKTGDGSGFKKDWFEHSKVLGSLDGNTVNMSRDEFAGLIDKLGGSPNVQHRIS